MRRRRRPTIRTTLRAGLATTAVTTALAAGVGTLLIFRSVALHENESFLARQASVAANVASRAEHFFLGPHGAHTFGARRLVRLDPSGHLGGPVPAELHGVVLHPPQLVPGHVSFVVRGDTVWALDPVILVDRHAQRTYAVVLHRSLPSELVPALFVVALTLLAALVAILLADAYTRRVSSVVADLAALAERVSRGDLAQAPPSEPIAQRELDDLRQALAEMIASLRSASERQTSFLLAISHDLRTPLTSIRGFAEAIEDGEVVQPAHAASVIQREAQRIERLLADLMSLARLEADGFRVTVTPLDLGDLVEHLAETARLRGRTQGLEVHASLAPDARSVLGDPERLSQALANILDNAVKFARSSIDVIVTRRLESVRIEITDDGPGIPPSVRDQLFSRQVAPRPGRNNEIGSGLGLLIAARLVQAMHGRLGASSPIRSDGGTRIVLELPAAVHDRVPSQVG